MEDGLALNRFLGENIARRRKDKGWSVRAFSARTGLTRFAISAVEHGAPAATETLTRIADGLDTTVDALLREDS